jgi:hypothetical protein
VRASVAKKSLDAKAHSTTVSASPIAMPMYERIQVAAHAPLEHAQVVAALEHAHGWQPQRRHLGRDPCEVFVAEGERCHLERGEGRGVRGEG